MTETLVIFDCDGVLVDSEPIAARVISGLLMEVGVPMDPAACAAAFHGFTMGAVVESVEAAHGVCLDDEFLDECQRRTFKAMSADLTAVAGVREVLDGLSGPRCVASNGELVKMRHNLGLVGLLDYFGDALFCAEQVAHGKPHPDLFLHAAREMDVPPSRAVVVEDSVPGVRGARAAGMTVFGYAPEDAPNADQWRAGLDAVGAKTFRRMDELPSLLPD